MMRIYSLLLVSAGLLVVAVADTGVAPHGRELDHLLDYHSILITYEHLQSRPNGF